MKRLIATCLLFITTAPAGAASAEDEAWKAYYLCLDGVVADVASLIESLEEGALLVRESLCADASTELANSITRREQFANTSFGEAFTSALHVIDRETRREIFEVKRGAND